MTDEIVAGMAEAIEARRAALNLTVEGLAEAAGLTRPGLLPLRNGHRRNYSTGTLRGMAEALGWRRDWYELLQAGVDAGKLVADDEDAASLGHRISSLPPEAQQAIEFLIAGYERNRPQTN